MVLSIPELFVEGFCSVFGVLAFPGGGVRALPGARATRFGRPSGGPRLSVGGWGKVVWRGILN